MAKTYDAIRQNIMEVLPGEQAATRAELVLAQIMGASMVVNLLRGADSPKIDIEYMNKFYARQLAELFSGEPAN